MLLSCVFTGEYECSKVAGAGLRQPVYRADNILYKDAVSHDGFPIARTVKGLFRRGLRFLSGFIFLIILRRLLRLPGFIPAYLDWLEGLRFIRYVYLFLGMIVLLRQLCCLGFLYVHHNQYRIIEKEGDKQNKYYCCPLKLFEPKN